VIAASLFHQFDKCVGIEYLESLYKSSLDLQKKYDERKHTLTDDFQTEIQFVRGDLAKVVLACYH
jgi:hypothetical protein